MNYRDGILRVSKVLAGIIFIFWSLLVLGDASQVPFTFPIVLDNHEQFIVLFVGVVFLSIAALVEEKKAETGD